MAKGVKSRLRQQAFQTLYSLSFAPVRDIDQLKKAFTGVPQTGEGEIRPEGFAWELTLGTWSTEKELDAVIDRLSRNWRAERIGRIELVLLRMALYELFHMQTPSKVVISENLELANQFGVESAKAFINGVLDAAARTRPETASEKLNISNQHPTARDSQ